ncbi:MAG TPA: polyphosphate kinase 2 family protein [Terriglobales bacterium]|jgi:PPK2 family polyphosphate:nucleotide phosphotransferase|nr:polyphosphate kinase 2 family protein [Terriglobales bacterium]
MSWASKLSKPYAIHDGSKFRLKDFDSADTGEFKSEDDATGLLQKGVAKLEELQDKLYAQRHWGVLLIFQAMDAAGKDGTIKHVMSGINPEGCQVFSFKQPSLDELDHDFLWRTTCRLPSRGMIGIFNRSYYEEVLVVRVHPEILDNEPIPKNLLTKEIWKERFQDIHSLERYLGRNGIIVRKFFLNVSKKEQKKRLLDRLNQPEKNWKFSLADVNQREYWDDYMKAYEDAIRNTSSKGAPWYVVPADNKWYTRLVVAAALVETLESLDLAYPGLNSKLQKELVEGKKILTA